MYSFVRNGPICVVLSDIAMNSAGLTEVSFYSLSNDGKGILRRQAVINAVQVGIYFVLCSLIISFTKKFVIMHNFTATLAV